MYYSIKLCWKQPKENTDEMKLISKNFLVYAESCTEGEIRMQNWTPSNYQDAVVEEVKKTQIVDLLIEGSTEIFWEIKLIADNDGRDRAKTHTVVLNALNLTEIVSWVL